MANKFANGTTIESDRIAFFNAFLSEAQMTALYSLADFYLCTSVAEGQNLPLLEAMAHGTVPVTTANTAMLDYIDIIAIFGVFCLCMIPQVALIGKVKPAGDAPAH